MPAVNTLVIQSNPSEGSSMIHTPKILQDPSCMIFMQDHEGSSMIHSPNNVARFHKIHPR